ncbi:hypothetical protein [Pseudomonas entomophila]|uniref:Uncharacterized protein n=2 Tax=Pseudomonas entomophila TaxID=312306 RepID=Q1IBN4_PSEE4|nr:hypothetical protein [Pseudomonas entomophila]WMW04283.1 hypothetical protein RAH46_18335 [Pseudomonas entomophila]CAK14931.1 hypothetical protein; putative signal peptide [Pseudomonas entomophila L48]
MKKFAMIALLATTGLFQVAHASGPGFIDQCPEGYFMTATGLCAPDFDFD